MMENYKHTTVLLDEAVNGLNIRPDGIYIDGTFGRGGHSRLILSQLGEEGRLLAIDRDPQAIAVAKTIDDPRFSIIHGPFSALGEYVAERDLIGKIDGILLDLGVSSPQLDDAERGFSFMRDGPLDMRMDPTRGQSAAEWLQTAEEADIAWVLKTYGEERFAKRIARAIVDARQKGPIDTTLQLAHIVEMAYPPAWRAKARRHPATRTFQALRMAVNDELGELRRFLDAVLGRLRIGGRLAVISFHSLEDRMVKQAMRHWAEGCRCPRHVPRCVCGHVPEVRLLHKKPLTACESEIAANPRSSCAKLRAVEKIAEAVS